jgi:hypothetical protein
LGAFPSALDEALQSGLLPEQYAGRVLTHLGAQEANPDVPVHRLVAREGTCQKQTFEANSGQFKAAGPPSGDVGQEHMENMLRPEFRLPKQRSTQISACMNCCLRRVVLRQSRRMCLLFFAAQAYASKKALGMLLSSISFYLKVKE